MRTMRILWAAGLMATAFLARAQVTTNAVGQVLIPELKPILLAWEYAPEEPVVTFNLWDRAALVVSFDATKFTVTGTTNGVNSYQAVVAGGFVKGTNELTLTVVGAVAGESGPSNRLPLGVLGKPLPPQALRKP